MRKSYGDVTKITIKVSGRQVVKRKKCAPRLPLLLTLGILLSVVSSFKKSAYAVSDLTFLRSQKTASYSNGYAANETSSLLVNPTLNLNRIG